MYKAKDRVVDKDGNVWQYNALYGTFRCVQDKLGIVPCSDFYSAEALEKKFGPLTKPVPQRRSFLVTVEHDYKVTVENTHPERRSGVSDRRVRPAEFSDPRARRDSWEKAGGVPWR
jgi:hypothetical protein